jgi:hypothetical protein
MKKIFEELEKLQIKFIEVLEKEEDEHLKEIMQDTSETFSLLVDKVGDCVDWDKETEKEDNSGKFVVKIDTGKAMEELMFNNLYKAREEVKKAKEKGYNAKITEL